MIRRLVLPTLAFGCLLGLGAGAYRQSDFVGVGVPPLPIGSPAPNVTLRTLDGGDIDLLSLRGKPVFIDFWATWCPPCRESLPETNKLAAEHGKDINVVAITNEDFHTIQPFLKASGYTMPVYRDVDKSAGKAFRVDSLPSTVILDSNGNIADYIVGLDPVAETKALAKLGIRI